MANPYTLSSRPQKIGTPTGSILTMHSPRPAPKTLKNQHANGIHFDYAFASAGPRPPQNAPNTAECAECAEYAEYAERAEYRRIRRMRRMRRMRRLRRIRRILIRLIRLIRLNPLS